MWSKGTGRAPRWVTRSRLRPCWRPMDRIATSRCGWGPSSRTWVIRRPPPVWWGGGRGTFGDRAVILGGGRGRWLAGLDEVANDDVAGSIVRGTAMPAGKTVFVFPGQGSQWLGMGIELLDTAPVFAQQIEAC